MSSTLDLTTRTDLRTERDWWIDDGVQEDRPVEERRDPTLPELFPEDEFTREPVRRDGTEITPAGETNPDSQAERTGFSPHELRAQALPPAPPQPPPPPPPPAYTNTENPQVAEMQATVAQAEMPADLEPVFEQGGLSLLQEQALVHSALTRPDWQPVESPYAFRQVVQTVNGAQLRQESRDLAAEILFDASNEPGFEPPPDIDVTFEQAQYASAAAEIAAHDPISTSHFLQHVEETSGIEDLAAKLAIGEPTGDFALDSFRYERAIVTADLLHESQAATDSALVGSFADAVLDRVATDLMFIGPVSERGAEDLAHELAQSFVVAGGPLSEQQYLSIFEIQQIFWSDLKSPRAAFDTLSPYAAELSVDDARLFDGYYPAFMTQLEIRRQMAQIPTLELTSKTVLDFEGDVRTMRHVVADAAARVSGLDLSAGSTAGAAAMLLRSQGLTPESDPYFAARVEWIVTQVNAGAARERTEQILDATGAAGLMQRLRRIDADQPTQEDVDLLAVAGVIRDSDLAGVVQAPVADLSRGYEHVPALIREGIDARLDAGDRLSPRAQQTLSEIRARADAPTVADLELLMILGALDLPASYGGWVQDLQGIRDITVSGASGGDPLVSAYFGVKKIFTGHEIASLDFAQNTAGHLQAMIAAGQGGLEGASGPDRVAAFLRDSTRMQLTNDTVMPYYRDMLGAEGERSLQQLHTTARVAQQVAMYAAIPVGGPLASGGVNALTNVMIGAGFEGKTDPGEVLLTGTGGFVEGALVGKIVKVTGPALQTFRAVDKAPPLIQAMLQSGSVSTLQSAASILGRQISAGEVHFDRQVAAEIIGNGAGGFLVPLGPGELVFRGTPQQVAAQLVSRGLREGLQEMPQEAAQTYLTAIAEGASAEQAWTAVQEKYDPAQTFVASFLIGAVAGDGEVRHGNVMFAQEVLDRSARAGIPVTEAVRAEVASSLGVPVAELRMPSGVASQTEQAQQTELAQQPEQAEQPLEQETVRSSADSTAKLDPKNPAFAKYMADMASNIDGKARFFKSEIEKLGPESKCIMDFGTCGAELVETLGQLFPQHTFNGLDISPTMLAKGLGRMDALGMEKVPGLVAADGFHPPIKSGSVDAVLMSSFFHELFSYSPRPHTLAGLRPGLEEIHRILAPNGKLIIRDPARPDDPDEPLYLRPFDTNGKNPKTLEALLATRPDELSTKALLWRFTHEFAPARRVFPDGKPKFDAQGRVKMPAWLVSEFIRHRTLRETPEHWASEMKEQYGVFTPSELEAFAREIGFVQVEAKTTFNPKNHAVGYDSEMVITDLSGKPVVQSERFPTQITAILTKGAETGVSFETEASNVREALELARTRGSNGRLIDRVTFDRVIEAIERMRAQNPKRFDAEFAKLPSQLRGIAKAHPVLAPHVERVLEELRR